MPLKTVRYMDWTENEFKSNQRPNKSFVRPSENLGELLIKNT